MKHLLRSASWTLSILMLSCLAPVKAQNVSWQAESFSKSSKATEASDVVELGDGEWLQYKLNVPQAGRYRAIITGSAEDLGSVWLEDYCDNKDNRTYNITGSIELAQGQMQVDGSPLNAGKHLLKIHAVGGTVVLDSITFELLLPQQETKLSLEQGTTGDLWIKVWSDEFDAGNLPDTSKWNYNIGNWGWGNNELQYYTSHGSGNAFIKDGNLIIKAIRSEDGKSWTSTRLTTQGKVSFLYGKIEFRAKVPVGRGVWSAGWMLGDDYVDELSWPYCGEIDILESVGFEIDDNSGDGMNHASCHTPAYYFKQGNQITSQIEMSNMNQEFHTYSVEWYPDVIYASVDGKRYYTYDKNANELEWPFGTPQDIILNLAVGGGWGGAKGLDEKWESHELVVDYVRVYEKK